MTNIVKSVQQISITITAGNASNTGTITSVTTGNTELVVQGFKSADTGNVFGKIWPRAVLTNGTTITITRGVSASTSDVTIYIDVLEYQSAALNSSIQAGTITLASVTSNTATISSVTTGKSACSYTSWSNSDASDNFPGREFTAVTLTNATTVTGIRGLNPGNNAIIGYQVVEYAASGVLSSNTQQFVTTFNTTGTAPTSTISSVTVGNSIIRFGGFTVASTGTVNATDIFYTIELTAATTVTFTRVGSNNTDIRKYYGTVIEFVSGVLQSSVQRGTISMTSQTSNTATITSVSTTYAIANWGNFRMGLSSVITGVSYSAIEMTNATTVTVRMNTSNGTANVSSYEVIEFAPVATGIAFDAASNSGYQTAQSSYSWSHTCTGSNRYLVVGISMLSVAGTSVSSITYAGVSMDFLGAKASVTGAARAELWGMIAPTSGSNTIAVTLSASIASAGGAVSFTGVNQSSATEALNSATATNVGAADATVNVTTVADNDWTIDCVATDDTAITVGGTNTSRNNVTGALGSGAMGTDGPKTPAGSITMSWTNVAALATWSIIAIALRPTAAANIASIVFRKTLSSIGGKVGVRQLQGWN